MIWGLAEVDEQRQAEWDRYVSRLPCCSVCGNTIYPGQKLSRVVIQKEEINLCAECVEDIIEGQELFYDVP